MVDGSLMWRLVAAAPVFVEIWIAFAPGKISLPLTSIACLLGPAPYKRIVSFSNPRKLHHAA